MDTIDEMVANYTVQRASRRWPVKLFFHLLDIAALNSYVIRMEKDSSWESGNRSRRSLFIERLAESLMLPEIKRRSWNGLQR